MRILLIENSRFLRTVIERILVKAGHSVTGAADGREG
jgi:CheY-like chemotaxis protein